MTRRRSFSPILSGVGKSGAPVQPDKIRLTTRQMSLHFRACFILYSRPWLIERDMVARILRDSLEAIPNH